MHRSARCHGFQHAEIHSTEMVFYLSEEQGGKEQKQHRLLSARGESSCFVSPPGAGPTPINSGLGPVCESAHAEKGIASQLHHVCLWVNIEARAAAVTSHQSMRMSVKSLCACVNGCGKNACDWVCCGAVQETLQHCYSCFSACLDNNSEKQRDRQILCFD